VDRNGVGVESSKNGGGSEDRRKGLKSLKYTHAHAKNDIVIIDYRCG
jgi:hypothetical protein